MRSAALIVVLIAGLNWVAAPAAQSLGDVARQGQAQHERPAGKRYSDKDLVSVPAASARAPQLPNGLASASVEDEGSGAERAGQGEDAEGATAADPEEGRVASTARDKRDETYWRTRAGAVKALVQRHSDDVTQLEARLASLNADTSAGAGRERQLTDQLLTKARRDLQFALGEVDSLERDARAKKIPAEWIQ